MQDLSNILISLTGLGLLVFMFFWKHKECEVDRYRDAMFVLRNRLFDLAADGQLSFDSNAYRYLRVSINGHIRFAHLINIYQVILFKVYSRNAFDMPLPNRFEESLSGLSEKSKQTFREIHKEMSSEAVKHVLLMSPIFVVFSLLSIVPIFSFKHIFTKIESKCEKEIRSIETMVTTDDIGIGLSY